MGMMANPDDVQRRLGRPFEDGEEATADTYIGDAENMIRLQLPNQELDADVVDPDLVAQVVGTAVARVLKNPEGYRSESAGSISYTIDTRAAAGFLLITNDEWRMLGINPPRSSGRNGAGSFAPSFDLRRTGADYGYPSSWA